MSKKEEITSTPEDKYKRLGDALQKIKNPPTKPLIQRVPDILRRHPNSNRYYDPQVVAIGPIHHGKPNLARGEEFKHGLAKIFLDRLLMNKMWSKLYDDFKKKSNEWRSRYEENIKCYNDEDLAWMFLVDGCAILLLVIILDCQNKWHEMPQGFEAPEIEIKTDLATFWELDLFLLENQIPYEVLQLLMASSKYPEALEKSMKTFISNHASFHETRIPKDPNHLLDLARENFLTLKCECHEDKKKSEPKKKECHKGEKDCVKGKQVNDPVKYSECIINICGRAESSVKFTHTFRNIKELQAAGIRVRKNKRGCLKDITFKQKFFLGTLRLPLLYVADFTASKFMNLIAFEMCPDFVNNSEVTSYVFFMDSLIDQAEDVKELRDRGVLFNALGSDEEVARLFNEISSELVPNPMIYGDVMGAIHKRYKNKWLTGMFHFYHEHFSTPWTMLVFIGFLLGLILSFIQAWEALFPKDKTAASP